MRQGRQGDGLSWWWGVGGRLPASSASTPFPPAGRPLLLHSGPVRAAVARALLLLPAQGKEQRRHGPGWDRWLAGLQVTRVVSPPPVPQGCPGLHQHLQHAPDVLPDARTAPTLAHQPCGLCEKWHGPSHPSSIPSLCPGPKLTGSYPLQPLTSSTCIS